MPGDELLLITTALFVSFDIDFAVMPLQCEALVLCEVSHTARMQPISFALLCPRHWISDLRNVTRGTHVSPWIQIIRHVHRELICVVADWNTCCNASA